jgi:ribosomal protein S18 acetylase RimI-like enzyme
MSRALEVRTPAPDEREAILAHLGARPQDNLFLIDLVARGGGAPAPGEMVTEIAAAFRGGEVVGVVALRPSVVFDAAIEPDVVEGFVPLLEPLAVGLVKSAAPAVDVLWRRLSRRGERRAVIDRIETAYALCPHGAHLAAPLPTHLVRTASRSDLESLVFAARESLREESRPDPFAGDIRGFRRWVLGRVQRARVVESAGRIAFVGYADVQLREGWLLQGIYTWPEERRRGLGTTGTSALCREAFAAGAEHVQLAVVDGNEPAHALYEGLGFKPFARLRTILFT